jgi:uncharacterized glyoxalase superfamily protein PhnB
MERRLTLVTLGVADVARNRRFYEQLGWKASSASSESIVFFQLGGGIALALYGRAALAQDACLPGDGSGFGGVTLAHNVRTREEVDAVLDRARKAGARILKPAEDAFWGGYSGYFADPDGHPWEVAWNPHFPLRDDGGLQLPE